MALGLNAVPEGGQVSIKGTLILASNEGSGIDSAIKRYQPQLRRLGFSSYRVIGGGETRIRVPGDGSINLGKGFATQIKASAAPGRRIPVNIKWMEGRKTLIHTSGSLPLVLGGPSYRNGHLILILDGK